MSCLCDVSGVNFRHQVLSWLAQDDAVFACAESGQTVYLTQLVICDDAVDSLTSAYCGSAVPPKKPRPTPPPRPPPDPPTPFPGDQA